MVSEAPEQMEQTEAAESTSEAPKQVSIMFQTPEVLNTAIESQAKAKNYSKSRWIREFLAESLGVTLPEIVKRSRAKKYATPEERAAAQKKRNETQRDVMKALMAKYAEDAGLGKDRSIEDFAKALGLLNQDGSLKD